MKILAELLVGTEAETAYGGRSVSYEPLGWAWLKLGPRRRRERTEAGSLQIIETVTAEAVSITKAELAKIGTDYKGTRVSACGMQRSRGMW